MNSFVKRSLTGAVFVLLLVGSIWLNSLTFFTLFLLITSAGTWEFYQLARKNKISPHIYPGVVFAAFVFVSNYLFASGLVSGTIFLAYIPLVLLIPLVELYRKNLHPFTNISYTMLGVIYVAAPFSLLNYFIFFPHLVCENFARSGLVFSPYILLGFFFLIWANDTGAYVVGSLVGKKRLFKRISPKKSWEGSIGGGLFALFFAYIISLFFKELTSVQWLVVAALVAIMGTYGDLVESLFKRSVNVKDSGNILPGHGGVLDRFDSALFAAPTVFLYLLLIV